MKVNELLNQLNLKLDIPKVILELDLGNELTPTRFSENNNIYNIFCKTKDYGTCEIIINFNNINEGSFFTSIFKSKNYKERPFVVCYTYGGWLCGIS